MNRLKGRVALVTGASRGAGRGIALALGEEGATVYVSGRSIRGKDTTDGLPGTIEETAEEITERGGVGIPVRCDHTDEEQIRNLFDKIRNGHSKLDILVNIGWGGYEKESTGFLGVWGTMVTSYYAMPLMLPNKSGLIVSTSISSGAYDWDFKSQERIWGGKPTPVFYDSTKTAINRIVFGMAENLRSHGICVLSVNPGWMRTERMRRNTPHPKEKMHETHSTLYVGRAIAALAADPNVMVRTGKVLSPQDVQEKYGFQDE